VASEGYLAVHGTPQQPADLAEHPALVYSTVQGDARWHFTSAKGKTLSVAVKGPLRSNNLSALLAGARQGMGLAVLPRYVAHESLASAALVPLLTQWSLPVQEVHAVFSSPRLVPAKVGTFISWLQAVFDDKWWAGTPAADSKPSQSK